MKTLVLDDLCKPPTTNDWNDEGVMKLERFVPDDLIGRYCVRWLIENSTKQDEIRWGGFPTCTPYMEHTEIRDLLCWAPLAAELARIVGEPMGVHLNLTGWVTTTRDWHQDQYLNEPGVDDAYCAIWVALDDIHPDSGPFQYVPGSHRWPQVDRELLMAELGPDEQGPDWPRHSERILTPLFEQEIWNRKAEVVTYLPKRGDVLVWHSRLLHRGSVANMPGMERRALIAHYSGVHTRAQIDLPHYRRHNSAGFYFVLNGGPV